LADGGQGHVVFARDAFDHKPALGGFLAKAGGRHAAAGKSKLGRDR
jgi:hypothetical protein